MKSVFINRILKLSFGLMAVLIFFASCKKDRDGSADVKPGGMQIDSISPGQAAGGEVLTLKGAGLGSIRSVIFDKDSVPATFMPTLNTDNALVFRVPDTAFGGLQHIIFTNSEGKSVSVPFTVVALASVSDASDYNFTSGTEITLTGNNLDDVTKVVLTGTTAEATILSKSRKQLVLSLPATDVNRATLDITNASGTVTTTQEFINVDKAFQIFTEGYMNGFENASWGPAAIASDVAKSGTKSFAATYAKGNWSADGFANWWPGVEYSSDYKYLTFWVKGASVDYTLYITGDQREKGYGNADQSAPITVPKNVWTYFKIPLSTLELWKKGGAFKQLGFWIKGPDAQDETFYFDDVMLVK